MGNPLGRPRPHGWRVGNHGYVVMYDPTHPVADRHGYVLQHAAIVAEALGHPLPPRACVHHVDEVRTNNANTNLVACENAAYHYLLHLRMRALAACGHADWRQCARCSRWDSPEALVIHGKRSVVHSACNQRYQRERYARRRTQGICS